MLAFVRRTSSGEFAAVDTREAGASRLTLSAVPCGIFEYITVEGETLSGARPGTRSNATNAGTTRTTRIASATNHCHRDRILCQTLMMASRSARPAQPLNRGPAP